MADNEGYQGTQGQSSGTSEFNAMSFVIKQILNARNFVALVKIVAVTAPGGLALAGTVDVTPLVNQLDGYGNKVPHGVISGLQYYRMQGGGNAIIMDPQVGDIGLCLFCDRDSSAVCATREASNPGSMRRSDMSDGLYIGGMLNAIPSQYVMFTGDGIKVFSPTKILLEAPVIELLAEEVIFNASTSVTANTPIFTINGDVAIVGNTNMTGDLDATGTIVAPNVVGSTNVTFGGKSGIAHVHSGVTTGTGQTGAPV